MGKVLFFAGLAVAASLVVSSVRVSDALGSKAFMQERATDAILKWDQSYVALGEYEKKWEATVPPAAEFGDLASLIGHTKVAPLEWPRIEKISIESLDVVEALYAYKACLADGSGGVIFRARNVSEAFSSIATMGDRKDILFDGINVSLDKSGVSVRFTKFCILMRG